MRKGLGRRGRLGIAFLAAVIISGVPVPYAQTTSRGVAPVGSPRPQSQNGPYYALVIGINNYQYLPKLQTASNDAREVARVLHDRYGFEVKLLADATHDDIFSALDEWGPSLPDNANLLIYYAGHGEHDRGTDKAYWLPADAKAGTKARWIMADDITGEVRALPARHVLIVSDSCYSGTLARDLGFAGSLMQDRRYLQRILAPKSRTLMSSGGDEPVEDGGAPGHSVFSAAFLRGLNQMDQDVFTGLDLFTVYIRRPVAGQSSQLPEYNTIRNSGDDGGDFVFFRSAGTTTSASARRTDAVSANQAPNQAAQGSGGAPATAPVGLLSGLQDQSKSGGQPPANAANPSQEAAANAASGVSKLLNPGKRGNDSQAGDANRILQSIGRSPTGASDVVIDSQAGLMWTAKDNGSEIPWESADRYCRELTLDGYTGWQLPTIEQLAGIFDAHNVSGRMKAGDGYLDLHTINGFHLTNYAIWSGKRDADAVGFIRFNDGERYRVKISNLSHSYAMSALCVRPLK